MKRIWKPILPLMVALALGGCNMVMTDKPMLSASNGAVASPVKPGVWRGQKPGCDFDETLPQEHWPKCADAQQGVSGSAGWLSLPGDPALLQILLQLPGEKGPEDHYLYVAYRPLVFDAQQRVIAMKSWPVLCGPPQQPEPSPAKAPEAPSGGPEDENLQKLSEASAQLSAAVAQMSPTKSLLPGMTMDDKVGSCAPDSLASLQAAATASEAWAKGDAIVHWVRDTGPGDLPPATPDRYVKMGKVLESDAFQKRMETTRKAFQACLFQHAKKAHQSASTPELEHVIITSCHDEIDAYVDVMALDGNSATRARVRSSFETTLPMMVQMDFLMAKLCAEQAGRMDAEMKAKCETSF